MPYTSFRLAACLLAVITSVSANSCGELMAVMGNQSDVDFYSKCPDGTFDYMLGLNHSWSGPFEMSHVKTVGWLAVGYLGPKLRGSDWVDDRVTTFSMPDLMNTTGRGVLFGYCPNLTEVSLPKLSTVIGDLAVLGNPELKELTLAELTNITGGALIEGDFDEINLPNLKTVSFLNIKSTGDLDCVALGKNLSSLAFTPPEYYFGANPGFTCRARFGESTYNSSDPNASTTSGGTGGSGTSGGSAPSSTTSKPSNASQVRTLSTMYYLGIVACLCGVWI